MITFYLAKVKDKNLYYYFQQAGNSVHNYEEFNALIPYSNLATIIAYRIDVAKKEIKEISKKFNNEIEFEIVKITEGKDK